MTLTGYKKVRKYIRFYQENFGFHQPYQILVDRTFCFAAFKEQINIGEQLPKYLNSQVKLLTSRCIIIEAEKISKETDGALTILKQYDIHECGHKEPVTGSECVFSLIGKSNVKHYISATQDLDLQVKLRAKAGVPLLYLHKKSPTLDIPSKASYEKVRGVEENTEEIKAPVRKKNLHFLNPWCCKEKRIRAQVNKTKEGKVRKRRKGRKRCKKNKNIVVKCSQ